jgi:hypothetical protein
VEDSGEEWTPIKIHLDFSEIENNIEKFKKTDLIYLKEKIMSKSKSVFEKIIEVRPLKKKLQLNSEKCNDIIIPDLYKYKIKNNITTCGIDADIVIFVALDDTGFY